MKESKKTFPIDLVYLWVDGQEQKFQKEKEYWQAKLNIQQDRTNCNARYIDNQELKYSLRSVEKNAPWINKIYIVTNGQIPNWLDLSKTDKIKIITHNEIMPSDALPTFNSQAIEACIANIPNLSEHFLLANDDCFINRPINPKFFFNNSGKPIVRVFKKIYNLHNLRKSPYFRSIRYSLQLIHKKYGKNYHIAPHHNIDAYLKSDYLQCTKEFPEEFNQTIHSKFRNKNVQRIIFSAYMLTKNHCKIKYVIKHAYKHRDTSLFRIHNSNLIEKINLQTPYLLCINDEPEVKPINRKNFRTLLEFLYSNKLDYEKTDPLNKIYINPKLLEKYKNTDKKTNFFWKLKRRIKGDLKPIISIERNKIKNYKLYDIYKIFNTIKISIRSDKIYHKVQRNYKKVLKRIKQKVRNNERVKVIFLVAENQKWAYQSLYNLLEKSEIFEPLVLVQILKCVHDGIDNTRNNLEENYQFFKAKGMNVDYLYKNNDYIELTNFSPDIIIYEQEGELMPQYKPQNVSKYALTYYNSYGTHIVESKYAYKEIFHKLLTSYFVEDELNIQNYSEYNDKQVKNCLVIGYPKLDSYVEKQIINPDLYWKNPEKFKIIYAPHHSFDKGIKLATFEENGQFILNLAKTHPETTWLFKPHPRFKFALLKNNIMTEGEINNYYQQWEEIGSVYTEGNYINIFKTSNLMITDCGSFLAEYLPTGQPLIRLNNPQAEKLNKLGEKIVSQYYNSSNNEELEKIFTEIVTNKNDYLKEQRTKLIKEVFNFNKTAAEKMYEHLLNTINT